MKLTCPWLLWRGRVRVRLDRLLSAGVLGFNFTSSLVRSMVGNVSCEGRLGFGGLGPVWAALSNILTRSRSCMSSCWSSIGFSSRSPSSSMFTSESVGWVAILVHLSKEVWPCAAGSDVSSRRGVGLIAVRCGLSRSAFRQSSSGSSVDVQAG